MRDHRSKSPPTIANLQLASLGKPPYQQPPFPEPIRNKLAKLHAIFEEVDPSSLEKGEDDFRRDVHPLREIAIWEILARAYRHFTDRRGLFTDQKRDIYATIVRCSSLTKAAALKQPVPPTLSRKKVAAIVKFLFAVWGDDPAAHLMVVEPRPAEERGEA